MTTEGLDELTEFYTSAISTSLQRAKGEVVEDTRFGRNTFVGAEREAHHITDSLKSDTQIREDRRTILSEMLYDSIQRSKRAGVNVEQLASNVKDDIFTQMIELEEQVNSAAEYSELIRERGLTSCVQGVVRKASRRYDTYTIRIALLEWAIETPRIVEYAKGAGTNSLDEVFKKIRKNLKDHSSEGVKEEASGADAQRINIDIATTLDPFFCSELAYLLLQTKEFVQPGPKRTKRSVLTNQNWNDRGIMLPKGAHIKWNPDRMSYQKGLVDTFRATYTEALPYIYTIIGVLEGVIQRRLGFYGLSPEFLEEVGSPFTLTQVEKGALAHDHERRYINAVHEQWKQGKLPGGEHPHELMIFEENNRLVIDPSEGKRLKLGKKSQPLALYSPAAVFILNRWYQATTSELEKLRQR